MQLNLYQYHLSDKITITVTVAVAIETLTLTKLEINRITTNIGIPKANCYSSSVIRGMFF